MKWILLILILLEAIYEGLYDRGVYKPKILYGFNVYKILSKFVQTLFIASFFYFAYTISKHNWSREYIIIYLLFRISLFNYVNALAAGRKTLLGTTSLIDRLIRILVLGNIWMYIILTIICVVIGILI